MKQYLHTPCVWATTVWCSQRLGARCDTRRSWKSTLRSPTSVSIAGAGAHFFACAG